MTRETQDNLEATVLRVQRVKTQPKRLALVTRYLRQRCLNFFIFVYDLTQLVDDPYEFMKVKLMNILCFNVTYDSCPVYVYCPVTRENQGRMGLQERKELKETKDLEENRETRVPLVIKEKPEKQVHQENPVMMAHKDQRAIKDHKETKVLKERMVPVVKRENPERGLQVCCF